MAGAFGTMRDGIGAFASGLRDLWNKTEQPLDERLGMYPLGKYQDGSILPAWPSFATSPVEAGKRAYDSGMPLSTTDPDAAEAAYKDMAEVALGTMLGGSVASMGSGAARGAVGSAGGKLRLGPVDRTPFGGGQADIFDGDRLLGRVSYAVDGSVAQIDDIAVADGSNSLGVSGIKALREAFREIEPNVTRFEGGRAPGMKTGAARQGAIGAAYPKRLQQLDIAANAKSGAAVPLALDAAERSTPQGIRAYHGSDKSFSKFVEPDDGGLYRDLDVPHEGVWFASDPESAEWFANMAARRNTGDPASTGPQLYPVDLQFKNPYRHPPEAFADEGISSLPSEFWMREQGHDGAIIPRASWEYAGEWPSTELKLVTEGTDYQALQPGTVYSATTGDLLYANAKSGAAVPLAADQDQDPFTQFMKELK